jgi:thiosulfate dehydrogenase
MLKGFILGVIATLAFLALAFYIVVRTGAIPAGADVKPSAFEEWAAGTSLDEALRRDAPKGANPVAATDENLIEGVKLFEQHCAICHGTAKGDEGASPLAKGLYLGAPQFATHGVQDEPEGNIFWEIRNGVRWTGMPAWKAALTDRQIWTVALFLKHMDKLPADADAQWRKVRN